MVGTFSQYHEYIDIVDVNNAVRQTKKQVWDGTEFVPRIIYHVPIDRNTVKEKAEWLLATFGPGSENYRDHRKWTIGANNISMDEDIYVMYTLRWG